MLTGTSMLGREKSVLGKLDAGPRERHVFRPFYRGIFPIYFMKFEQPCLEEKILNQALRRYPLIATENIAL